MAVGAQVSYPDLLGFGRRFVDIDPAELEDSVLYQLSALQGVARAEGTQVCYVKPHGALYNAVVTHEAQAAAVVAGAPGSAVLGLPGAVWLEQAEAAAVVAGAPGSAVLGLPGAVWLEQAEAAGLRPVHEVFADRAYTAHGTLVPRGDPGAVVHGDTSRAVDIARRVRDSLVDAGVRVAPFA